MLEKTKRRKKTEMGSKVVDAVELGIEGSERVAIPTHDSDRRTDDSGAVTNGEAQARSPRTCLLYTSDAADD